MEPFLEEALGLVVELTGAQRGYVELWEEGSRGEGAPRFWMAKGCYDEEVEEIRKAISQGIIAEAIATGQTVVTESALRDPRFWTRPSVRLNRTEAVLCAPVGGRPPAGVVYLQDRSESGPFTEEDRQRLEVFARHLATLGDRLLLRHQSAEREDATLPFRRKLKVEGFVGKSRAMAELLQQMSLVAPLEVSVLLTGPSGTGKTQVARLIHENSPRAAKPFVELNCAGLPETLLESELFGSEKGAHSTAVKSMPGKVAAAEGGTLFLDEVGELHPLAQAKLLQFLQSKAYYPLGGTRLIRAEVRILAATNVDLRAAVERKAFREDLLYRLEVLPVRVPALSERREDIGVLVEHFCARACATLHFPKRAVSFGALLAAQAAEWPGNVRELEHRVQAAVIRAEGEKAAEVERRHLFPELFAGKEQEGGVSFQEATRQFQEQLVRKTLGDTGWNVTEAAHRLELSRSHLYNLITAFGLEQQRR